MTSYIAMGTTGQQLDSWCRRNKVKGFVGVFCSDNLPEERKQNSFCLIVNHSPCDSPSGGSHWLAVQINGRKALWFDSFGNEPDSPLESRLMGSPTDAPPEFVSWMNSQGCDQITWNNVDVQAIDSDVCGLYAAYFCKVKSLPQDGGRAWSFVTTDRAKNDATIRRLVRV